jgi:hypothetical protein
MKLSKMAVFVAVLMLLTIFPTSVANASTAEATSIDGNTVAIDEQYGFLYDNNWNDI